MKKASMENLPTLSIAGRVAYVVNHSFPHSSNGYAVRTHGVATGLVDNGHSVIVINRPGRPWDIAGTKVAHSQIYHQQDGVKYLGLPQPSMRDYTSYEQWCEAASSALETAFRVFKPAVVIAASNWENAAPALLAAQRLKLPFYYEVRGFWELSRASSDPAWQNSEEFSQVLAKETAIANSADKVITLNLLMQQELIRRGVASDKILLLPNGINQLPVAATIEHDVKPRLKVGYIGSFAEYEGLDDLLQAAALLRQSGLPVSLSLVGSGNQSGIISSDDIRATQQLLAKADQLGITRWVNINERVANAQIADYYQGIDVIVNPRRSHSVTELVSSLKPVEAAAYGKPVLLSDVAPNKLLADECSAFTLFSSGDVIDLTAKLKTLLTNAELYQNCVQKGYRWLEQRQYKGLLQPLMQSITHEKLQNSFKLKPGRLLTLKGIVNSTDMFDSRLPMPTFNVEDVILLANELAEVREAPLKQLNGKRVVIVVSDVGDMQFQGYRMRTQQLAKFLEANNWHVTCLVNTHIKDFEQQTSIDGIHYTYCHWTNESISRNIEEYFRNCVDVFTERFKDINPQLVIAATDFAFALPAIVSAKRLSLNVVKEQLHYADSFLQQLGLDLFKQLDFSKKYALEQVCINLADASCYYYPTSSESFETVEEICSQFCGTNFFAKPLAVLKQKEMYTVEYTAQNQGGIHFLELDVIDPVAGNSKGIVANFRFFDTNGKQLSEKLPSFSSSNAYPQYQYVDTSVGGGSRRVILFELPAEIHRVEVDIIAFVSSSELTLRKAKIGSLKLQHIARWLSLKTAGMQWIKVVEPYVHKEGAVSLRLALLNYKYSLSQNANDKNQLNAAIQEMVELDRDWLPTLAQGAKKIKLKTTGLLTVAHIHKTAYPYENSGGAIRCLNTVLSQKRINIDPFIITPIGYPRSVGIKDVSKYEVIEGIEHFRIGPNTDGLRGISLPDRTHYSAFHLAKIIKQRGANVIHAASGVRGYELALQALAVKKLTGLPLLYEVRSFHEHTWSPVRSDVMDLEKTQLRVIKENFCMAEADFVTTISYSMRTILIERGVSPDKIEVIPNAIDENKYLNKSFKPADIPELKGADQVVGYISNMSRREGHQYLIRAIHHLRNTTGKDIRGLLVGNGPERENLERLVSELGMTEIVVFTGEVDHRKINSYYKAIDLFVIPRIPDYAADWVTPLKPYEAMALGVPIIVTDLPALREIVGDNEERGLIAKPGDVDSLSEQLKRYLDNPSLREDKINTAKKWVFAERTWSSNAKRYELIYNRLLANEESKALQYA